MSWIDALTLLAFAVLTALAITWTAWYRRSTKAYAAGVLADRSARAQELLHSGVPAKEMLGEAMMASVKQDQQRYRL